MVSNIPLAQEPMYSTKEPNQPIHLHLWYIERVLLHLFAYSGSSKKNRLETYLYPY
jgi:hypothetical protein